MRQIILDTETSGLDFEKDRIIEIGCLELIDGIYSGNKFHRYYNPESIKISSESEEIHGLSNSFLSGFPTFDKDIENFVQFISDSQLIMHNAQFDLSMINQSLRRLSRQQIEKNSAICTLEIAKKKFPGSKNNLNALCRRFNISLESRKKHGALTDSFLLLEVFNELMSGGKQKGLELNIKNKDVREKFKTINYKSLPVLELTSEDLINHSEMLKKIRGNIWEN